MVKLVKYFYRYSNFLFVLLGFILIIFYMWFRFIRIRLPREIPFDLTLFNTIILLGLIINFILIIKQYIRQTIPLSGIKLYFIEVLNKIKKPFFFLDTYLRNNLYFKIIIKLLFILFFNYIYNYNVRNLLNFEKFYIKWFIIARIILATFFIIDIFYIKQLFLIYIFAFLSIIPLIIKYFLYLMKQYIEEYIIFLEKSYEVEEIDTSELPLDGDSHTTIRTFLIYQELLYKSAVNQPYKYECVIKWTLIKQYFPFNKHKISCVSDLSVEQKNYLAKDFYHLMPLLIDMYCFTLDYTNFTKYLTRGLLFYRVINILLYNLYLLGWLYILIISLSSFYFMVNEELFLMTFQDTYDPFSGLKIYLQ